MPISILHEEAESPAERVTRKLSRCTQNGPRGYGSALKKGFSAAQ
jgi:hypothetical protein